MGNITRTDPNCASGLATETTLSTLLTEADFNSKTGSLTETAPATDTASSGLNGRLQRIAQRITSLIALFPTSIGQKTKAGSLSVVLASDQNNVPITLGDSASVDAFGRLRTSLLVTIFDTKLLTDKQPLYWDDQQVSGAGTTSTYNTNQASTTIAVSNLTAGRRVQQTFRWLNYQPGKSQIVLMTGVFGTGGVGITKRLGQFNDNNGYYFEQSSLGFSVNIRSFTTGVVVNTSVLQSSWNVDKMDGTGVSGITLDVTKAQIFIIDYEWLGAGRVRFGFNINGTTYYCHQFLNANTLNVVYVSSPNLPLRYSITNDGTGAANSLTHICTSVNSEGGVQQNGFDFSVSRGATKFTTLNDSSIYPVIAIRLKSTNFGSTVRVHQFSIMSTTTCAYAWYLIVNPTIVGTALSFTAYTNASFEYQINTTNATTITAGTGTVLDSGVAQATNESSATIVDPNEFALGSSIAGVSDILVLAVQRLTGTAEDFYAALNLKDQH